MARPKARQRKRRKPSAEKLVTVYDAWGNAYNVPASCYPASPSGARVINLSDPTNTRAVALYLAAAGDQVGEFGSGHAVTISERHLRQHVPVNAFADALRLQGRQLHRAAGRGRAVQRRTEADHHRAEWQSMRGASDDPPTKGEAAEAIAKACRARGKHCSVRTVRDHLKGA